MTFKRILLKLSGESLMGEQKYGIDEQRLAQYAQQIKQVVDMGIQVGIMIGGGNIFRGLSGANKGFDRVKGDQMGMLATTINALGLSSALKAVGVEGHVFTAIHMFPIGEQFSKWRAIDAMEKGEVAIFAGGTGCPYFTTDTGSALRGIEIEADVDKITYDEIYNRKLKVMDLTATTLCQNNKLPIIVFNMDKPGNLVKLLSGENLGTLVYEG